MADLVHGKASTYNNHRCRCEACRKAHAAYNRTARNRVISVRVRSLKVTRHFRSPSDAAAFLNGLS